ncbi:hypothetical protein K7X08_035798 [Anisodus acutangulus]|uniref:Annexin n=1 Tax=Anisodus acutangulus TaxID=402998 RepID=A0A9Q1L7N6_9SOLA|nr:hypothetical protein K7X08_035798 [Anisodus acutangulus]
MLLQNPHQQDAEAAREALEQNESLRKGNFGEFEEALEAVVKYIYSPTKYFAQMLDECLKGTTRDKGALIRILVSRAEVDMEDILLAFNKRYGVDLKNAIRQSIPQGYYI